MENTNNKKYQKLKIYISGYGPFMSVKNNPSQVLVESIVKDKDIIHTELDFKCEIVHDCIYEVSVDYVSQNVSKCHQMIEEELDCGNSQDLHLIVHFGVNAGADKINLEKKCKNYIQDYVKLQGKINEEGEDKLVCKLNLEEIVKYLQSFNHNVSTSDDAGNYLCNYIYYKSSEKFHKCENVIPIFIHIPNSTICSTEECQKCFVDFLQYVGNQHIEN